MPRRMTNVRHHSSKGSATGGYLSAQTRSRDAVSKKWSSCNLKFFCSKRIRGGVLIQRVKRRPEGKERGYALDDLAEPPALIIRQRIPVAAVRLPISKPFLQHRVTAEL